jgi:RNA polymerase sigma-70 factor, ECF subfamily
VSKSARSCTLAETREQTTTARQALALAARQHHGQLLAILIKDVRDFQLAEDSLQDAIESALVHWPRSDVPHAPMAWLLQTARRKAIDRLRRAKNLQQISAELTVLMEIDQNSEAAPEQGDIPDERLRLIFTCCHPALDPHTSVALSLRTLCGLTTAEIARAFVVSEETMAQRLVRARQKISKAGIAYAIPEKPDLLQRLQSVLNTIYLTFNEGYAATRGEEHLRVDLCDEAIRLARLLNALCPNEPEAMGLLALLLLTHARRLARRSETSAYIPLDEQNRSLWDQAMIVEGDGILLAAIQLGKPGPYQLQAAISAIHAQARTHAQTRWNEIMLLYDRLYELSENPVYRLNRAVAVSFFISPNKALEELSAVSDELQDYQPFHAARADVLRRAGDYANSRQAYDKAIALSQNQIEKNFLRQKRAALLS